MGVQINGDTGNVIATKGTFSGDVGIGGTLTYEDVTNVDYNYCKKWYKNRHRSRCRC